MNRKGLHLHNSGRGRGRVHRVNHKRRRPKNRRAGQTMQERKAMEAERLEHGR